MSIPANYPGNRLGDWQTAASLAYTGPRNILAGSTLPCWNECSRITTMAAPFAILAE